MSLSSNAMVALHPPIDVARELAAEDGLAPEDLHVTLVFLGPADNVDVDAARAALASFASGHDGLGGEVTGVAQLATDPGPTWVYLLDLPRSAEWYADLRRAFESAGVDTSAHTHGWIPHMTIAYPEDGDEDVSLDGDVHPQPVWFGSIFLHVGDQAEEFPLSGRPIHETKDGRAAVLPTEAELESAAAESERMQLRHERLILRAIERVLARMERVVVEKIQGPKVRRETKWWNPAGTKALDLRDALDRTRWDEEMRGEVAEAVRDAFLDAALSLGYLFDEDDGVLRSEVERRVDRILGINEALERELSLAVREAEEAAPPLTGLVAAVRKVFERARGWARRHASDTATGAVEGGRQAAAVKRPGALALKVWVSRRDDKVRPTHREAHGQVVGLHDRFRVGAWTLYYPGDPGAGPEETCNCRCTVAFVAVGEAKHAVHDQSSHGRKRSLSYLEQIGDPNVPLDRLAREDEAYVARMAEAMRSDPSQFGPVLITRDAQGREMIEDGHHRILAARLAGLHELPVEPWPSRTDPFDLIDEMDERWSETVDAGPASPSQQQWFEAVSHVALHLSFIRRAIEEDPADVRGYAEQLRVRLADLRSLGLDVGWMDEALDHLVEAVEPEDEDKAWREGLHPRDALGRFAPALPGTFSARVGTAAAERSTRPDVTAQRRKALREVKRVERMRRYSRSDRKRVEAAERRMLDEMSAGSAVDLSGVDPVALDEVVDGWSAVRNDFPWLAAAPLDFHVGELPLGMVSHGDSDSVTLSGAYLADRERTISAVRRASDVGWHPPVKEGREVEAVVVHAVAEAVQDRARRASDTADWGTMVDAAVSDSVRTSDPKMVYSVRRNEGFTPPSTYFRSEPVREATRIQLGDYAATSPREAVAAAFVAGYLGEAPPPVAEPIVEGVRSFFARNPQLVGGRQEMVRFERPGQTLLNPEREMQQDKRRRLAEMAGRA